MNKTLKRILIALVALVVLVGVGTVVYVYVWDQADEEFDQGDVIDRLDATTVADTDGSGTTDGTAGTSGTDAPGTAAPAGEGADGEWVIGGDSEVGYRVEEVVNGLDKTANGRTTDITGSLTIEGTTVTAGEFTVDMTTVSSDQDRRDGQFRTRIMEVDEFPTAAFVLTAPIEFGEIPDEGGSVTAEATGDLTLHGVTKSVTFEVEATFKNGRIGVLGKIPVVFADYDIENPSFGSIKTEDNGLLEFVLILDRA